MQVREPAASESIPRSAPRLRRRHVGIAATGLLLLAVAVIIPAAALNFTRQLVLPGSGRMFVLAQPRSSIAGGRGTLLQLTLDGVTPWDNTAHIRVAGQRACEGGCDSARVLIASIPRSGRDTDAIPTVATLDFPAGVADVDQAYTVPIEGEWIDYPFDRYTLTIGIDEQFTGPDRTPAQRSSAANDALTVSLRERLTDFDVQQPRRLDPASVAPIEPGVPYALTSQITLSRPFYDEGVTIVVILLAIGAAAYAVFMRPFHELAIGATSLTLSLWGVRSLLMGSQPGTTSVDLILISVIIFVLVGIVARVLIALIRDRETQ